MSGIDIVSKLEKILSEILSDKYDAQITIKFKRDDNHGNKR